ncbi:MAG: flagellar filament capping protein FliD [Phycisphaeraceae bacterium]|nr:flagellar filament capping protein FliD [Phycisphaeraceae bacterium]
MGTITTGVGLISGINTAELIDQLIALDSRPVSILQSRVGVLQSQQAAFQNINAQLLGLKTSIDGLVKPASFNATTAASSNEEILTASSSSSATPGTYSFLVSRLVSSQQTITRGFGDTNSTPLPGGTLTFERGEARLDRDTNLDSLNGGSGIRRGYIRITDRSGASALIDLSRAVTVDDVLDQINNATGIRVLAEVNGDGLKITDLSGETTGNLIVANVGTSSTASSLGLLGNSAGTDTLSGTTVNTVGRASVLATLNDGTGIRMHGSLNDFRITASDATTYDISLANATNLGDVIDEIEEETGGVITAAISADGLGLVLTDTTGGGASFTVTALNSSNTAADLGILGDDSDANGQIGGTRLTGGINSKLLRNLNGGAGVTTLGTINIQTRDGNDFDVDLAGATSVTDVIRLINAAGGGATASLNNTGNGLLLTDSTSGGGDIVISDSTGSAAADLGLAGTFSDTDTVDSGNLQFRYITPATSFDALGIVRGKFILTDSSGKSATVDLTQGDETTIGDVLNEINSRGLYITASINASGDGILLTDTNAAPISKMKVEESGSTTAASLGILGEADTFGADIDGSFEKTVSITANVLEAATLLSTLNDGEGIANTVGEAEFTITTRDGATHDIDLDGVTTVQELIDAIATQTGGSVTASINAIEAGLKLTDNTSGSTTFKVEAFADSGSTAAADLGIEKSDTNSDGVIGGGSLVQVTTLQDLVTAINEANVGVVASIINDGSPGDPYRLSLSSENAGSSGSFVFDDGGLGFNAINLTEAQDAVVFFGGGDPAKSIALISSSNTLDDVLPGLDITLKTASSQPVTVTIAKDTESITSTVQKFVENFNALVTNIDNLSSYDTETEKRGLLLGDSTVAQIKQQLFNAVIRRGSNTTSQYNNLLQVGISVSGGQLQLDTAKFQAALANDPVGVKALFTYELTEENDDGEDVLVAQGPGQYLLDVAERLTDVDYSPVQTKLDSLAQQVKNYNARIESLNQLLEQKRARLESQFAAMESALATLQTQNGALNNLASLASNLSASNG